MNGNMVSFTKLLAGDPLSTRIVPGSHALQHSWEDLHASEKLHQREKLLLQMLIREMEE